MVIGSKAKVKAVTSEAAPKSRLKSIKAILAIVFFLIWIPVGLFFLLFVYGNFRQGAFKYLLGGQPPAQQQQQQTNQPPAETTLPGVGVVNIGCVQSSLKPETLQKLTQPDGVSLLTAEEKSLLEPCIVQPETAASPSPNQ